VTGTVTDPGGAVVPGVTLTATHIETNIKTTAQSNEAGVYTIAQLEGRRVYSARAGRRVQGIRGAECGAAGQGLMPCRHSPGGWGLETKIEVTGGATLIETETARISDSKDANLLKALPLNTRSLYSYLALSPNVLSAGFGLSYRRFAGSRGNQGDVSLDGVSISTAYDRSQISPLVNYIESYAEVRTDMANNGAEFGAIGQVTVISKSGTNQFHGSVFDYYSTPWFRARNPFALQRGTGIQHTPGFSIGGPISLPKVYSGRNKTFFFFSYETSRGSAIQDLLNSTVPLPAWRTGNFASLAPGTIVRDVNGTPFPDNQIPASRINPVSQKLQDQFWPLPNLGRAAPLVRQNYRELTIRPFEPSTYLTARVDHRFSDKAFVFGRWTWNDSYSRQFLGNLPTIGQNQQRRDVRNANLSFTYNVKSNLVNEFRSGISFNNNPLNPPTSGKQIVSQLGLVGLVDNLPDIQGLFKVRFSGLGLTAIDVPNDWRSPGNREFNYTFQDLVSWFHARHSVKAGIIIAPHFHADKLASPDLFGTTTFTNRFTGFPYADFLLGIPSTAARAYPPIGYRRHWLNDNFFVTDDFKVNSKLTLNLGVRYEYRTNFTEANGREAIFDVNTGKISPTCT